MQSSDHGVSRLRRARLERATRDSVATHRALFQAATERRCDICEQVVVGDDGGSGLYVWTRGGEIRFEEPPLCPRCGPRVALAAMRRWEEEEEDEGE